MDTQELLSNGLFYIQTNKFEKAIQTYAKLIINHPYFSQYISANLTIAKKRYLKKHISDKKIQVVVCAWDLAHNAAGRAYILAEMYQDIANVELLGCIFPRFGKNIWEPIRESELIKDYFIVNEESEFIKQAIELVSKHPCNVVHLSKPRASNIIFGILFKFFWDSTVYIDIDDEELSFVTKEETDTSLIFKNNNFIFPDLKNLTGKEWTQFSVNLIKNFDGITVSNKALQDKYGGIIIRHARDQIKFKFNIDQSIATKKKFGIPFDKKIVLFLGTPLPHKGLYETACAISSLKRNDIIYLIVGSFKNHDFRLKVQSVQGCNIYFLDNQPFVDIPKIISIANCCVFLQDKGYISKFQTPAKITDALAMGVPIICTNTYGISDLNCSSIIKIEDIKDAANAINECLKYDVTKLNYIRTEARSFFEKELSYLSQQKKLKHLLMLRDKNKNYTSLIKEFSEQYIFNIKKKLNILTCNQKNNSILRDKLGIIILNLDGDKLLENLFNSIYIYLKDINFKIILIDHNSKDNSKKIIEQWKCKLPIEAFYKDKNYTFSFSNNVGAKLLNDCNKLLFLNNYIIFKDNIIKKMSDILDSDNEIGVVGVDQVEDSDNTSNNYHHLGIDFSWDSQFEFWRPFNITNINMINNSKPLRDVTAVTGSVMLVRRNEFLQIGGFDEGYIYGYEDVDLCLTYKKLLKKRIVCIKSNNVFHKDGYTRKQNSNELLKNQRINNITLLKNKYNSTIDLIKKSEKFNLNSKNISNKILKIAFAVSEIGEHTAAGDYFTAIELGNALSQEFNWEIEYRQKDNWYELNNIDIVIAMIDSFNPKMIKSNPTLIKIAWARNWFERWSEREWCKTYDLYITSSQKSIIHFFKHIKQVSYLLRIATNSDRFFYKNYENRPTDVVFIGNYWNADRDIIKYINALPSSITCSVYGKNWDKLKLSKNILYKGFIDYKYIYKIYQNSKIVIDDANHVTKYWGSINSRVYDALASGCLVITNSSFSSYDIFGGELPFYKTQEELNKLIIYFLNNEHERIKLVNKLRNIILSSHTYKHRAYEFRNIIFNYFHIF